MWVRLKKEMRWLMLTSLMAVPLSLVFWLLYRLNDLEDGAWNMKVFWTGFVVMFGCVYIARILIRFIKNAAEA